jgi:glycosyltransferase involved in cell wall biosynthesis
MGGGTRLKLLEAMALARPVVSTTLGAEGFPVTSGRELLLADSAEGFARAVLSVLQSPGQARALGEAGRLFARRYDWAVLIPRLEDAYARLTA